MISLWYTLPSREASGILSLIPSVNKVPFWYFNDIIQCSYTWPCRFRPKLEIRRGGFVGKSVCISILRGPRCLISVFFLYFQVCHFVRLANWKCSFQVPINKVNVKYAEYVTFVLNRISSSKIKDKTSGHRVIYLKYLYISDKRTWV